MYNDYNVNNNILVSCFTVYKMHSKMLSHMLHNRRLFFFTLTEIGLERRRTNKTNDHLLIGTVWSLWQSLSMLFLYPLRCHCCCHFCASYSDFWELEHHGCWLAGIRLPAPIDPCVRHHRNVWKLTSS